MHQECIILDEWFNFQLALCNGYHDVLMMSMNLNDIAILIICGVDYFFSKQYIYTKTKETVKK